MQPRQRSQCVAIASEIRSASRSAVSMSTIRPRGESISSPQRTYVGQVGRQKPQWTQVSITSPEGGRSASTPLQRELRGANPRGAGRPPYPKPEAEKRLPGPAPRGQTPEDTGQGNPVKP